ncbi:MAG: ExeM/NucH family extracellular endonuclease [Gammaproteobacteria bacterium]|nr:ExeM/NucH family extracellular endonuclease [Gammaproteobacteria bacterium]
MRQSLQLMLVAAAVSACGGSGGSGGAQPIATTPGATPVYVIQGNGPVSPFEGQTITTEGVVSGDFQDNDADDTRNLGGFFLQGGADADLASSDGIFVFDGDDPAVDVDIGDAVSVAGIVTEFFGETQITAGTVTVRGRGTIQPTDVRFPVAATLTNSDGEFIADLERYEGMLIRLPQTFTASALFELERYGAVWLAQGGRPFQFTNQNTPDIAGYRAHRRGVAARTIVLDDGRRAANVTPIQYLTAGTTPAYTIRSGDQVSGLTGNLRFARGSGGGGMETYRLMPTTEPLFDTRNPRPPRPAIGGALRVASLNVANFFSTIDSGRPACGPAGADTCRGADSIAELERQLAKLTVAIDMIAADILGLVEIENNGDAALQRIVAHLNATGGSRYDYVATGVIGDDAITTGFIFKTDTVALHGPPAILDARVDSRFDSSRNRPALAQSFVLLSNDAVVSVVVNHLKSKSSSCAEDGDPNVHDGQSNCNATRNRAAAALANWIAVDPTGSGDPDYLIIGDLNAYLFEDPLTTLKDSGFVNLIEMHHGTSAYSFMFDGQAGALDHALATASLVPQVAGAIAWHINADEPRLGDYNLDGGRDPDLFDAETPYRVSDHDPVIVDLDLDN